MNEQIVREKRLAELLEGKSTPNMSDVGLLIPPILEAYEGGKQDRLESLVKLLHQAAVVK